MDLQDQVWIITGTFGGVVLIIAITVVIMILKVARFEQSKGINKKSERIVFSLKSELKGFERYSPEENLGFQEERNQRQQPAGILSTDNLKTRSYWVSQKGCSRF